MHNGESCQSSIFSGVDLTLQGKQLHGLEAVMENAVSPLDSTCECATRRSNWSEDVMGLALDCRKRKSET